MSKMLISLSGGIDSGTLLGHYQDNYVETVGISFYYGSKHNQYENEAARMLAAHYRIELIELDISQGMAGIESNLLLSGADIPEGHYQAENMKSTVVPARNMIFISIMTAIAISRGLDELAIGVHAGDHAIYPDCRPEFIRAMNSAVELAGDFQVRSLRAPFILKSKADIVNIGLNLHNPVPYHLTRTCYKDQVLACGKCGSCIERLEAFKINGFTDPIAYEKG